MPLRDDKATHILALQRFHETENLHNIFEGIELVFLQDWKRTDYKERIHDAYTNTIRELGFWERYLSQTNFAADSDFSIADCTFYPNVAYLVHRGLDLKREGFPKLKAYVDVVGEMQCAKDARPVGWEKPGKNLFVKVYEITEEIMKNKESQCNN